MTAYSAGHDAALESMETADPGGLPAGLMVSQDGYSLGLDTTQADPGRRQPIEFTVVHPDGTPGDGRSSPGPNVVFYAEVPSDGNYRLYLDFRHRGVVRTATFAVSASVPRTAPATPGSASPSPDSGPRHAPTTSPPTTTRAPPSSHSTHAKETADGYDPEHRSADRRNRHA